MLLAVLALPLCVNAKVMSYVFEGEVTSSFSSSIIADTNISEPATISGIVTYDTNANGIAPSVLGSMYRLISVELTITSQTDVKLTLSSDNATISMRLFGSGVYIPTIDITNSDSINTNWAGGGLGTNTSSYIPDRLKIIFSAQTGLELPNEAEILSPNPFDGGIEIFINGHSVEGKSTSIEVIEGNKSKAKSSDSSDDSESSGGAFSPITGLLLLLPLLFSKRVFRAGK